MIRLLQSYHAHVKIIVTKNSLKFVGKATWDGLFKNNVYYSLWNATGILHVELVQWADVFVIAPATANLISKMALGLSDNLLTCTYISCDKPVILAPAMDHIMWNHPSTQRNIQQLRTDHVTIIPPSKGLLASGITGDGRLASGENILQHVHHALSNALPTLVHQKNGQPIRVLLTLGGTRESIDSVRYITNHSSGKMGWAMVKAFQQYGADVTAISTINPMNQESNNSDASLNMSIIHVESAEDMYTAVLQNYQQYDVIVMVAAVSDFTIKNPIQGKLDRKKQSSLSLILESTKDILWEVSHHKLPNQTTIGFALDHDVQRALHKKIEKQVDFMVVNSYKYDNQGFNSSTNAGILLDHKNNSIPLPLTTKEHMANSIVQHCIPFILHTCHKE